MAQHTFTVSDIHCDACENAIRKSLSRLDGVRDVRPDAVSNRVAVSYDDAVADLSTIAARLEVAGYPVMS